MYSFQPNITKFKYVASTFEIIASKFCLLHLDPEGWDREGGGRGDRDGEHM